MRSLPRSWVRRYYDAGGATVKLKRLPLLPQDRTAAGSTQAPDVEDLISTRTFQGPRPMTALDSTTYSHAKSLHTIRSVDPFLRTTSQTYGSRLPIEQVRGQRAVGKSRAEQGVELVVHTPAPGPPPPPCRTPDAAVWCGAPRPRGVGHHALGPPRAPHLRTTRQATAFIGAGLDNQCRPLHPSPMPCLTSPYPLVERV